ncbi:MAG: hypothetical protein K6G30_14835, partial [Acetatifactor sp.]|nr:hypothetical protein [Acetatifactor sp.]
RGDVAKGMNAPESSFVDVAVNEYGIYAVLDQAKGRIFLYDFDGNLINIFGQNGNVAGHFKQPGAIAWAEDKLLVTDRTLNQVFVFEMTDFGRAALGATEHYYYGNWAQSADYAKEALRLNANYDLAYVNLGKYYLMKDDYSTAMYYFRLGNDRSFYSKAFNGYRSQWIESHFSVIITVLGVLIFALIYSEMKYHRGRGQSGS